MRYKADHCADGEPEETPRPSASARTSPPPSSLPPSPPPPIPAEKPAPKKGPGKKTKKLGNNQYTKARDLANQAAASSPHSKKRQTANNHGGSSGDEQLANGDSKVSPGREPVSGKGGKLGKGKHKAANGHTPAQEPRELTVHEMERRVDLMSTYMQRAQIEMAGDRTPPATDASLAGMAGGAVQAPSSAGVGEKGFEELSSMEQADALQRGIMKWKQLYGV